MMLVWGGEVGIFYLDMLVVSFFVISINFNKCIIGLISMCQIGIFNCGDLMMSKRYVVACLRYVSGVMAVKGI